MTAFNRFMAKHSRLAFVICSLIYCVAYTLLLYCLLDVSLWVTVIIDLFLILIGYIYVDGANQRLLVKPLREFNDGCDPYPLLHEMEEQLTYKLSEPKRQVILMNYCVALRDLGEYTRAYELLSGIHIDKCPGLPPVNKYVYYNNLSDLLDLLGRDEEAEIWCRKAAEIYSDIREGKAKERLSHTKISASVGTLMRRGEYSEALKLLSGESPSELRSRVDSAFICAKCHIALGNKDAAAEKLRFVMMNGNKMHCVKEAKALLEQLD